MSIFEKWVMPHIGRVAYGVEMAMGNCCDRLLFADWLGLFEFGHNADSFRFWLRHARQQGKFRVLVMFSKSSHFFTSSMRNLPGKNVSRMLLPMHG